MEVDPVNYFYLYFSYFFKDVHSIYIVNNTLAEPKCGWPSSSNQTTAPFSEYITITKCTKYQEFPEWDPCTTLFQGQMKMGDYFSDESNNNTFQYMGDGSVCYSVYKNFGGCTYRDPIRGCEKDCFSDYTSIFFYNIYDYYSCINKIDSTYHIYIGNQDGSSQGNPSSSNRIMYSMFSLLLVFIVGLLI
ncbi:hypothetical protein DICPUDRAFT_150480 [Dictyostelium purpureum]|uniref:Uncharacterized protein n=1 Tax=Dictyostelium purpureum TaxID=5786 RepID=F0ZGF2_DICPU|nr:uncharacterized protein DICPUDRAFT_150480 [Dictyostelium purpureum]EGC36983.1 hypothetical protein DICPUDRAFT_150480 [Dictyostelium purpureum]|eukprot:XP_003286480.1 hypothetical protein DICPUDRAFT_150480 [Dictyostelium purpureum]